MKTPSPHSWLAHGFAEEAPCRWNRSTLNVEVTSSTQWPKSIWPKIAASFLKSTSTKQKKRKAKNK